VQALLEWRQAAKQWDGPVFRRLSKTGRLINTGISGRSICTVVQFVVKAIGLENPVGYSAHSLRRGFATELARRGASKPAIQKHGRWKTTSTVVEYVEAGRSFDDSAAKVLYDFSD
jgi:integrase